MSRARDYIDPRTSEVVWFDTKCRKPTDRQLELLALVERTELDDLLDEHLTQAEVHNRLYASLREEKIPAKVLERRDRFRAARAIAPTCRICEKEGDSTNHHFINKWILRELSNYDRAWSSRAKNCIPVCIDCHRDLHMRDNGPVSIAEYLTDDEKVFAEAALSQLAEERPKLLILIARGDDNVYEARLVKDWIEGKFRPTVQPAQEYRIEVNGQRVAA